MAIAMAALVALILLLAKANDWRAVLRTPAAVAPLALFAMVLVSASWSPQPLGPGGISHYAKLLLIPLLMAGRFTPEQAATIAYGFLAGCLILLALSFTALLWPAGPWTWFKAPGVPVKDNGAQSISFALCAFGLAFEALRLWRGSRQALGLAAGILAVLFLANIFIIYFSKTGVMVAAALAALFFARTNGWRRNLAVAASLAIVVAGVVLLSSKARLRISQIGSDIQAIESNSDDAKASISTASRMDFWRKAVEFIGRAPLFGHGAGSTKSLYTATETDRPSPYGEAVPDPHNQFLAIAIQTGIVGGALLILMWVVHFTAFLGDDLPCIFGQAIVAQNVLSSLFNSSISQVTQGTLYCLAIGLLAGLVQNTGKPRAAL
jgi:O-antigen ligase